MTAILCMLLVPSFTRAQTELPDQTPSEATPPSLVKRDIETWLDGFLPHALKEGKVAGAVVSVVKDNKLLFAKGYGYADLERQKPMDPFRTIIRPGSISKLFTWTAIMQLVERGQIDLDTDVNNYLDFQIPAYNGRPVTMRNIVTHTTGFEESFKDIMGRYPQDSLERYVKSNIPTRLYPPGEVPAYSNYASALAGYIIQRVAGESFEDYADRHIFQPLGMTRSTFRQPVPEDWRNDISLGYRTTDQAPGYYEFVGPFPAGSLNTTGADMANFMIAHLNKGRLGDTRILSEKTAQDMHAPQKKIYPRLNAMAIGFYETSRNGNRSIAHNGGTQYFHSDLHLLTEEGVGTFIALNSAGDGSASTKIHNAFFTRFMDRYFPRKNNVKKPESPTSLAKEHARQMAGYWQSSVRSATNWFSLSGLFSALIINDNKDGSLIFSFPFRGQVRWIEIEPYLWRSDDLGDHMEAIVKQGQPVMFGVDAAPPAAFLPVPWWRSPGWITPSLIIALLVMFGHGLSLPIGVIWKRFCAPPAGIPSKGKRLARISAIASLGLVAAFCAYAVLLIQFSSDLTNMSERTDLIIYILMAVTLLLLILTAACVVFAMGKVWTARSMKWKKAYYGTLLIALGILWWVAITFKLVNFDVGY